VGLVSIGKGVAQQLKSPPSFTTLTKIAVGGFGVVYSTIFGNVPCAVKEMTSTEEARKEASAVSKFSHPHVVDLFCFYIAPNDIDSSKSYLIYEYADTDLARFISSQNPSLADRLHLLTQAAKGLSALHLFYPPLVHRDVKASNYLVYKSKTDPDELLVKIADFGGARQFHDSNTNEVKVTSVGYGTPGFRAPELLNGKASGPSLASDIYSFGVMMFDVLRGPLYLPKYLNTSVDQAVRDSICAACDLKNQKQECTGFPNVLKSLITACLKEDPSERPDVLQV
jgi:serine/threonine protein kinase